MVGGKTQQHFPVAGSLAQWPTCLMTHCHATI